MPPFVGRKRSPPFSQNSPAKKAKVEKKQNKPPHTSLKGAQAFSLGSESESSLSEVDSEEFEDVIKPSSNVAARKPKQQSQTKDDSDDEDMEFVDVVGDDQSGPVSADRKFTDVKLNIARDDEAVDYSSVRRDGKKGPNRREKAARIRTHQSHVQFLLWHNAIRNSWIGDKKVQDTLVKQLPSQIVREIEKWKRASGLAPPEQIRYSNMDKKKRRKRNSHRDWGQPSQRLEEGKPDMSHGDPIISLLKVLSAYWKKRFAITAPGLRKRGYGSKLALKQEINSYRNERHHPAKHGERIRNLDEFRELANKCEGSRDVGAQLFTALLRAIGIEARIVASLQPAGYGWTKAEQMVPRKIVDPESSTGSSEVEMQNPDSNATLRTNGRLPIKLATKTGIVKREITSRSGESSAPIDLYSDHKEANFSSGDESVIDTTPSMPKARPAKYDRDLVFPIYWTEVVSHITSKVIPVSPLVLENSVATSPEIVSTFEPRGAKADKARQVIAYVIAYSSDGSAKDVTVRYLRKKLWPGKTKGFRFPIEKIPIYNERGKVVDYEEYDWFENCMRGYIRPRDQRQKVDELEDIELVPASPDKKVEEGDTLQGLKSSTEWILERHLRREEALKPGAKADRIFVSGKGDKQIEEAVYSRKDVERCLTTESWHKEGRIPKEGEMPMKFVPVRAVTLTRKREAEEHKQRTGETQMQGLYSIHQTEYIIPPPIKDGKIPKNAYGNIDCFVDSMIPRGAVHVPLKGTMRLCKKLEIDFAEAVVGFEFGNKMAVPVIQGVVIAEENEQALRDAWQEWNVEQKRREDEKLQKQVLELWRKFAIGLRIRQRVSDTYDVDLDEGRMNSGATKEEAIDVDDDEDTARGFMPAGAEEHEEETGGGFLVDHEDHVGNDLVMEEVDASQQHDQSTIQQRHDAKSEYSTSSSKPSPTPDLMIPGRRRKAAHQDIDEPELSTTDVEEGQDDDMAGGFEKEANEVHAAHNVANAVSDDSDDYTETSSARAEARRQNDRTTTRQQPMSKTTTKRTRAIPARSARAKAPIIDDSASEHEMDEDDDDDEDDEDVNEHYSDPVAAPSTPRKRGRGRPRGPQSKRVSSTNSKNKRLLRKNSTLVTSPYFGRGSQ